MKVLLILVDGMRPDALKEIVQAKKLISESSYTIQGHTVMPSVTLPCHMSLFHSVDPSRHGTTTNIYAPQVRPIEGLCEVLKNNGKSCAFFYDWEELRDISKPGSLSVSYFINGSMFGCVNADRMLTNAAIQCMKENKCDFIFLYLGVVDETGHTTGWMSKTYMEAVQLSWNNIEKVLQELPEDYTVIVTADHGGHERIHGTDVAEDITIPVMIKGKRFQENKELESFDIKDIAPTVTGLLGVKTPIEWEGKCLV